MTPIGTDVTTLYLNHILAGASGVNPAITTAFHDTVVAFLTSHTSNFESVLYNQAV